jgi:hypothetical protein
VSVVSPTELSPRVCDARSDGWRCLRLAGVFDLSLTGILNSILTPLATARISVFTLGTFDTDYILIRAADLDRAIEVLESSETARVTQVG